MTHYSHLKFLHGNQDGHNINLNEVEIPDKGTMRKAKEFWMLGTLQLTESHSDMHLSGIKKKGLN